MRGSRQCRSEIPLRCYFVAGLNVFHPTFLGRQHAEDEVATDQDRRNRSEKEDDNGRGPEDMPFSWIGVTTLHETACSSF